MREALLSETIGKLINPDFFIIVKLGSTIDGYSMPARGEKLDGLNVYHIFFSKVQIIVKVDSRNTPQSWSYFSNYSHLKRNCLVYTYNEKTDKLKNMALHILNKNAAGEQK